MRLREFDKDDIGNYNADKDNFVRQNKDDPRRPKVTLVHLNLLKKMRASRYLENLVRRDILAMMYGAPPAEGGGMPGGI
jgi:hypothetical protein